ncbi:MAG: DUF4038 domain-containing protein [Bacteroidaceae bacterium]|nr:DUF4038 domain-containing protein [Bacteroidaceae bacterium]
MKTIVCSILICLSSTVAPAQVERWGMYETSLTAPLTEENPFNIELKARFENADTAIIVNGYYDGIDKKTKQGVWRIRFMPMREGVWHFVTISNTHNLNGKSGDFSCIAPSADNHGPVMVDKTGLHFKYADGKRFMPVGTTSYDWMHATNDPHFGNFDKGLTIQEQTLKSLEMSGFNKVRSLLLVHNFDKSYPEPDIFPFEREGDSWDWTRLNPRYFDHVEEYTLRLMQLGIEQDLILFHPYDEGRWGFDAMPREAGMLLCKYVTARFGAIRNIWWSMANEYDGLKKQPRDIWDVWTDAVIDNDPYHHLISIHSFTAQYYKYWDSRYTHCSIQDQAPVEVQGGAAIVRNIYKKPVIFDEICYEGDMTSRWGCLTGEEELYRMWQAYVCGTYATHAECFQYGNPHDFSHDFLAVGGKWMGESWKRIKFMRSILDDMAYPMYLADSSWDPCTSACGPDCYMVYLGKQKLKEWVFNLPAKNSYFPRLKGGERFKVEVIDTWNMTITECPLIFETTRSGHYRMADKENRVVPLTEQPYILLRIKRIN